MPTICARLGRFIASRYFSISSPSCFCAPADTPPTWFITFENSGDVIAWLAKELNPFSISPSMVCQITAGSLPLSAIGALSRKVTSACHASLAVWPIPHRCDGPVNHCQAFCGAGNHAIVTQSSDRTQGKINAMLAHQPPQIARANGIDICYEIFGDPAAAPLLLIMGLGAQMIHWDDDFCRQLAAFASSASTTATSASPHIFPAAKG